MNTLQQALKSAGQRYGQPSVGTITPGTRTFAALTFGGFDLNGNAEVTFLKAGDGKNVYRRLGSHSKTEVMCAREFGANLDRMAEYAEQHTAKAKRKRRETLRCYERRFSTSARWVGAVVEAQRIAALNVLYAEYNAHKMDARALMRGVI